MNTPETSDHLFLNAFRALPTWQKWAIAVTATMTAPFMLMLAAMTGLSLLPFLLLGRWEGTGTRLTDEVKRVAHDARAHTERVYAS